MPNGPQEKISESMDEPDEMLVHPPIVAAAHRVFWIAELLEQVLLQLPLADLLIFQRINKEFKQAVEQSPAIQEALYFRQGHQRPPPSNTTGFATVHPPSPDCSAADHILDFERGIVLNPLFARCLPFWFRIRDAVLALNLNGDDISDFVVTDGEEYRYAAFEYPKASWRKMLMSQPIPLPVKICQVIQAPERPAYAAWKVGLIHGDQPALEGPRLENVYGGLTMFDPFMGACELFRCRFENRYPPLRQEANGEPLYVAPDFLQYFYVSFPLPHTSQNQGENQTEETKTLWLVQFNTPFLYDGHPSHEGSRARTEEVCSTAQRWIFTMTMGKRNSGHVG